MRTLMLALVLLNLGLFGWSRWVATPTVAAPPRVLAKDVEVLSVVPRAVPAPEPMAAADAGVAVEPVEDPVQDGASPETVLPAAADTTTPVTAPAEVEADAPPQGDASPPPEVQAVAAATSPAPVQQEPVELAGTQLVIIAAPDQPDQCASIGPFIELAQAAEFAAVIREMAMTPSQRLLESDVWVGYAVMLPPLPTRGEGLQVAQSLREAGIEDIYVEPGGELRNAVSLGLFSDRRRAARRAAQISELGFSPVIRDRTRTAEVYWVDFVVPAGRRVDLSRFEQPGRRLTNGECAL